MAGAAGQGTRPGPLAGCLLLLVEDDFAVAELVLEMLEAEGVSVIGPIGSLEDALSFLDRADPVPDLALLDINLRGRKSYPVADRLDAAGIAFAFASGYGTDELDPRYRDHPRCEKPFRNRDLIAVLSALAAVGSGAAPGVRG